MRLVSLTTENFRNLAPADSEFHPAANLIIGRNGQGKTNLLEAIYFLATTRSFRTTRPASLFRFDAPNLFVSGTLEAGGLRRTLSAGLESGESRRRVLTINGEKVALPVYLDAMRVIAYSAARLDAVRGTPEERRRFLDRGVAGVYRGYLEQLTRYQKVLRQRNALLVDVAQHRQPASALSPWDAELVATAEAVQRSRNAYASELSAAYRQIVERHAYHVRDVEIRYTPSTVTDLDRRRPHEIRARMTLAGPQRDLLELIVAGRPAAEVLSGGEQKMTVLFLKFAKIELLRQRLDDSPLFLLDDIDAELDLDILHQLLRKLPAETQLFATSAKGSFLVTLATGPHRRLTVEEGRIKGVEEIA